MSKATYKDLALARTVTIFQCVSLLSSVLRYFPVCCAIFECVALFCRVLNARANVALQMQGTAKLDLCTYDLHLSVSFWNSPLFGELTAKPHFYIGSLE